MVEHVSLVHPHSMYSTMVDDITSMFLDDITITMMLPLDHGWTHPGYPLSVTPLGEHRLGQKHDQQRQ